MQVKIPVPPKDFSIIERIKLVARQLREKERDYPVMLDGLERVTRLEHMGKFDIIYEITYEIPLNDED